MGILACFAVLATTAGCGGGGDDPTRAEIAELRAELADVRKKQARLQKAVAGLQKASAGRPTLAQAPAEKPRQAAPAGKPSEQGARRGDGKPEREVVRIIPTGSSPRLGADVAGATVVMFADFQCAFCQAAAGLPKALVEAYPDDVLVVFKNFPLARHPGGLLAAKAAWAAHQQGKFWEMYELIYGGDIRAITPEVLRGYAEQLGLDMERYQADATSTKAAQSVAWDKKLARRFKVGGTPTYFVNGRAVRDRTPAGVQRMVAEEIARLRGGAGS